MIDKVERQGFGIKEDDSLKFFQYYPTYVEAQLELADYLINIDKNFEADKFSDMWEDLDKK